VIRWIGEAGISPLPIAAYGIVLLLSALGYTWLERAIIIVNRDNGVLAAALRRGWKERLSLIAYIAGILLAFMSPWVGLALYISVAIMWLIPDRRIERRIRIDADSAD